MAKFTLYHGKEKPLVVYGGHCVRLVSFAYEHKGWHTFNKKDRATRRAVESLLKKGCITVDGDMFRFKYP